jgi:hypothetical protein
MADMNAAASVPAATGRITRATRMEIAAVIAAMAGGVGAQAAAAVKANSSVVAPSRS